MNITHIDDQFAEKLHRLRIKNEYTQNQLGELVGVTGSYISRIERRRTKISSKRMTDMIRILKIY